MSKAKTPQNWIGASSDFFKTVVNNLKGFPGPIVAITNIFSLILMVSFIVARDLELKQLLGILTLAGLNAFICIRALGPKPTPALLPPEKPKTKELQATDLPLQIERLAQDKVEMQQFFGYLIYHENKDFRDNAFEVLKRKAKRSILVMGMGITNIRADHIDERFLRKGIDVRLLMMDPNILLSHFDFQEHASNGRTFCAPPEAFDVLLKEKHIDDYFHREEYFSDVANSYKRLKKFTLETLKRERENPTPHFGKLEMRVFNSFIPMSITAVNDALPDDTDEQKEFIAEFLLPFSAKRIMLPFSRTTNKVIYDTFMKSIAAVWKRAVSVEDVAETVN